MASCLATQASAAMVHNALIAQLQAMLGIVLIMALPIAFKLLIVIAMLVLAGPLLVQPLVRLSGESFDGFPAMTR